MDLDDFVAEYNGVRNAHFIMWGALLTTIAQEKGADGERWLKDLRERSIKELNAVTFENSAGHKAHIERNAEIAKSVINGTFDFAEDRRK